MVLPTNPPDAKTFNEMIGELNRVGGEPRATAIITHLYIEYLMDSILRRTISKPDKVIRRLGFASKLELIESLQVLSDGIMHELSIVNEVRNQFAHRIDMETDEFQEDFKGKVHRMNYYNDNACKFEGMETYQIYYMIMPRVYAVLKGEYDNLQTPNLNTNKKI
ncbi:MAG: hypothetical protein KGH89_03715 [Thaumarchaeota archaeon]|nr:hypothetical protein [Nitrososphaerota archaeon]MDE1867226.1 hypothetical protein [Nitrososphaerota archaeon]